MERAADRHLSLLVLSSSDVLRVRGRRSQIEAHKILVSEISTGNYLLIVGIFEVQLKDNWIIASDLMLLLSYLLKSICE